MSKPFYAPKGHTKKGSEASSTMMETSPATTPTLPSIPSASDLESYVRFVLKTGAALEFKQNSVEEVTGTWADSLCRAVCGTKEDGVKVAIPVDNIDYMEGAC